MDDDRPFGERVAAQADAELKRATRTRLPDEERRMATALRVQACDFGDLKAEAIAGLAIPLMSELAENGYRHAEHVRMFGPIGGSPRQAVHSSAARYREATLEERGQLLFDSVCAGLDGQFAFDGEQSVDKAFETFWAPMQDMLGNEPRLDKPAADLFMFGAALYAVETTILLELIREDRYARAEAAIERDERRRRLRFWNRG